MFVWEKEKPRKASVLVHLLKKKLTGVDRWVCLFVFLGGSYFDGKAIKYFAML